MRAVLAIVPLVSALAAGGDEQFNGRWNITVKEARNRAWWLEVNGAGTPNPTGKFVGAPGGQVDRIPELKIRNGELEFAFERRWRRKDAEEPEPMRGVWRARLVNGKLHGVFSLPGQPDLPWTGERAPVITDRDDGSWRRGAPVQLFDGKDLSGWMPVIRGRELGWTVKDGAMTNTASANNLVSEQKFWNFELHVEYRVGPKSNSGIGLRSRYEVQILEDYGRPLSGHSNGGIYSRIQPAVNVSKPAGEWQTFDIRLVGRTVTVKLNGTTIIDKGEIEGPTAVVTDPHEDQPGPLSLQGDHGPVEFRKIVVTPLVK